MSSLAPLEPFLSSLAYDGIKVSLSDHRKVAMVLQTQEEWSLDKLRQALITLLAKNPDQITIIGDRFDAFFSSQSVMTPVDGETVGKVVSEFQAFDSEEALESGRTFPRKEPWFKLSEWRVVLFILALSAAISVFTSVIMPSSSESETVITTPGDDKKPVIVDPSPAEKSPQSKPRSRGQNGVIRETTAPPAGTVAVFTLLCLLYLWHYPNLRPPLDDPWQDSENGYFDIGAIGQPASPILDRSSLDAFADALARYRDAIPTQLLDVGRTVDMTAREAGLPIPVYQRRTQLLQVMILEDTYTESFKWNSIPRELVAGLRRRGVHAHYGRFAGTPSLVQFDNGALISWDRLEQERDRTAMLMFSNGHWLEQKNQPDREMLVEWPRLALLAPASAEISANVEGLACASATTEGLMAVAGWFVRPAGERSELTGIKARAPELRVPLHTDLHSKVEWLLGDALLWAQDCAMIQPVSFALVDALRRRFHPEFFATDIERLLQLPATRQTQNTISFSPQVLALLRSGFAARRSAAEQQVVLKFILAQIEKAEPQARESAAHAAWEITYQRVRLELEPDEAAVRLAELGRTSLRDTVTAQMQHVVLGAGLDENQDRVGIPLRLEPTTSAGRRGLAEIAEDAAIPVLQPYPLAKPQWFVLGSIAVLSLVSAGWALIT